jgi:hypothetical protein
LEFVTYGLTQIDGTKRESDARRRVKPVEFVRDSFPAESPSTCSFTCCSIDRICCGWVQAGASVKLLPLNVALTTGFIARATPSARCKPHDLGLFISDMRMAGARDDRSPDHGRSRPCPHCWKMCANWRRVVARPAATGLAIPRNETSGRGDGPVGKKAAPPT